MIVSSDVQSYGLQRVVTALEERPHPDDNIKVLHVNGRCDKFMRMARRWRDRGGEYVVAQYVIKSSLRPDVADWLPLWNDAKLVWSYYDLPEMCRREGHDPTFNFYHSPLGISSAFRTLEPYTEKRYKVVTHGDYLTQSTRECVLATNLLCAHLGEPFAANNVDFWVDIADEEVSWVYDAAEYVSGLRRTEGFELPAAVGLACGARPILFDRDHYTRWYEDKAVYISEGSRDEVLEQLRDVFSRRPHVSDAEVQWARDRFNWDSIIEGLYERL